MQDAPETPPHFVPFNEEDLNCAIPDYLERVVARYPDKIAVHTRTERLTYHELNRRANQAARRYLSLRPSSDEPIAVMFGHGAAAIVALVAALKCGKPYVALLDLTSVLFAYRPPLGIIVRSPLIRRRDWVLCTRAFARR